MNMKKLYLFVITFLLLFFMSTSVFANTNLSLGHIVPTDRAQHIALQRFADLVEERTNGEITIDIFPAAQLGDGPEQVNAVSLGAQDMFNGGLTWWDQLSERVRLVEVPFMWESREHFETWVHKILATVVQEELIENHNQRFIDFGVLWRRGPHRAMCATRPIFSVSDLKKLKLRMWDSEVANKVWNGFGISTTVMPWGDAYFAIKMGAVEAVTSPMDSIYGFSFHEIAPYITELHQFPQITGTVINEKVWQSLSNEQQEIFKTSLNEAGTYFNKLLEETIEPERIKMMREGAAFIRVDIKPFAQKAREEIFPKMIKEGLINEEYFSELQSLRP
ncbi:2,3-diketo-L-gulonate-binding periplasmic protein YiaO [subsurface metagenome]